MGWNMDRKLRSFCVSVLLLLLCLDLQLLYAIEARTLDLKMLDCFVGGIDSKTCSKTSLGTMMHSGPSPGGKGHTARKDVARVLTKLKDFDPSHA
ncbi:hypothetical protein Lal_00000392 [Lupinus albus]|uniref:Uncharacterized protein n=1 Tax=Lupinus albus TaxID=3870 RepID=A0A6A4NKH0_LUPAL|nr:hypothetical protein Lalb_Chr21g0308321 [Lupinus albus]KAF1860977.1 hypothetical protein Lal_00000392 [Lupinus albus]